MYTNDPGRTGGASEQPYQSGRSDPLWSARELSASGLLTPGAARALGAFVTLGVADCGWHRATATGWVTMRGVTYTPRGWNALVASDTSGDTSGDTPDLDGFDDLGDLDEPLEPFTLLAPLDAPSYPSFPALPLYSAPSASLPRPWGDRVLLWVERAVMWGMLVASIGMMVMLAGWVALQLLAYLASLLFGHLAATLVSGLLSLVTGMLGR